MPDNNGNGTAEDLAALATKADEQLEDLTAPLESMLIDLRAETTRLREEREERIEEIKRSYKDPLARLDDKVRRVERTLKTLDTLDEPRPKAKARKAAFRPSEDKLDKVEKTIGDLEDGATIPQLAKDLPWSRGTVENCVMILRQEERVRKAGRRDDAPGRPVVYKSMKETANA